MNAKYHDCSENSYCFNLRGTYTCSCKEGNFCFWVHFNFLNCSRLFLENQTTNKNSLFLNTIAGFVDMSENPLYPGRVCSAEMMGCDRCNYHGSCIEHIDEDNEVHEMLCDCFQWYAGEKCQYNLKGKKHRIN